MIDIHSHVLYGVDDGAQSLDETRALLRQAYDQGIKTLIATPHQRKGRFEASRSTIDKHFQNLQTIAREVAPDLTVHLGTEVFYSNSMLDRLEQGQILTLAGSDYVLVEFDYGLPYREIVRAIRAIQGLAYDVVIAHIERYDAFHKHPERVQEMRRLGCLIQVNAASLLPMGLFDRYKVLKKRARQLLDADLIDIIASDAHHVESRPYYMAEAYAFVAKKYGADYAHQLFVSNPEKIIGKGSSHPHGN